MGDFNCKNNDWCRSDVSNLDGQLFKTYLDKQGFEQLVNFHTRFDIHHSRKSCIDFVITNNQAFVRNIEQYGPIVDSKIPKLVCYHRHVWNFKKGDFEKLNRLLSEFPWDTIFILDYIS